MVMAAITEKDWACGDGGWTLVMKINGNEVLQSHASGY